MEPRDKLTDAQRFAQEYGLDTTQTRTGGKSDADRFAEEYGLGRTMPSRSRVQTQPRQLAALPAQDPPDQEEPGQDKELGFLGQTALIGSKMVTPGGPGGLVKDLARQSVQAVRAGAANLYEMGSSLQPHAPLPPGIDVDSARQIQKQTRERQLDEMRKRLDPEDPVTKRAEAIRGPQVPPETYAGTLAAGAASTAVPAVAGILTAPLGGFGAFATGSMMLGGEMLEDARSHGATAEELLASTGMGSLIGLSEGLPLQRMLNRALKFIPRNQIKRLLSAIVEEGSQEAFQSAMQNVGAKAYYDEDRGFWDGVGEAYATGGAVGAFFELLGITVGAHRRAKRIQKATTRKNIAAMVADVENVEDQQLLDVIGQKDLDPESEAVIAAELSQRQHEASLQPVDPVELDAAELEAALGPVDGPQPTDADQLPIPQMPSEPAPTEPEGPISPQEAQDTQEAPTSAQTALRPSRRNTARMDVLEDSEARRSLNEIREGLWDAGQLDDDADYELGQLAQDIQDGTVDLEDIDFDSSEYYYLAQALNRAGMDIEGDEYYMGSDFAPEDTDPTIFDYAKQHHGTTDYPGLAGYILPDGEMLDFSESRTGGGGYRSQDHRAITFPEEFVPEDRRSDDRHSRDMEIFKDAGGIRISTDSGLIDVAKRPTMAQFDRMTDAIEDMASDQIVVDLKDGDRTTQLVYLDETVSPRRVLSEIRAFYNGEDVQPGFRASQRQAQQTDLDATRRNFEQAQADESSPYHFRARDAEMVSTVELAQYADIDRRAEPKFTGQYEAIRDDIAVNGIREPLVVQYGQDGRTAIVGEGNTRLAAAQELGIPNVPVRVIRRTQGRTTTEAGTPARTVPGIDPDQYGYVPEELRPSQIGLPSEEQALAADERLSNVDPGATQIAGTKGTYDRVAATLPEGETVLDYGAGLGTPGESLGDNGRTRTTLEPFPKKGFVPDATDPAQLEGQEFDNVVSLNVVNVLEPGVREEVVRNIVSFIAPGGQAIIGSRGKNAVEAASTKVRWLDGWIIKKGGKRTFQKGFTQRELIQYVQDIAGPGYTVTTAKDGTGKKRRTFGDVSVRVVRDADAAPQVRTAQTPETFRLRVAAEMERIDQVRQTVDAVVQDYVEQTGAPAPIVANYVEQGDPVTARRVQQEREPGVLFPGVFDPATGKANIFVTDLAEAYRQYQQRMSSQGRPSISLEEYVQALLRHEVMGHQGLAARIPDDQKVAAVEDLWFRIQTALAQDPDDVPQSFKDAVQQMWDRGYLPDIEPQEYNHKQRYMFVDEFLAHFAENETEIMNSPLGQRIVDAIKAWWQQFMGQPLTEAAARRMLRQNLAALRANPAAAQHSDFRPVRAARAEGAGGDPVARALLETLERPEGAVVGQEKLPGTSPRTTLNELGRIVDSQFKGKRGWKNADNQAVEDALFYDIVASLAEDGNALGWYETKLAAAMDIMADIHPELATDPNAQTLFRIVLAVTSNGADVNSNFINANELYTRFKREGTGRISTTFSFGADRKKGMIKAFENINMMLDEGRTLEEIGEWLVEPTTVKELKAKGHPLSGELAAHVVRNAMMFGPKLGSFYGNLAGFFESITMDLWYSRTFARLTGTLRVNKPTTIRNQVKEGLELIERGELRFDDTHPDVLREQMLAVLEADNKTLLDPDLFVEAFPDLMTWATGRYREFAKGQPVGDKMVTFSDKVPDNYVAKNIRLGVEKFAAAPDNGSHRKWMRDRQAAVQERLVNSGLDINNADIQAVLWYIEKDFFAANGVGNVKALSTDYESAARNLRESLLSTARSSGVSLRELTGGAGPFRQGVEPGPSQSTGMDAGGVGSAPGTEAAAAGAGGVAAPPPIRASRRRQDSGAPGSSTAERVASRVLEGQEGKGAPDRYLANTGLDPEVRNLIRLADEEMGALSPETVAEWEASVDEMLAADYKGVRDRLLNEGPAATPEDATAARRIINDEFNRAFEDNDEDALIELAQIHINYRQARTDQARALAAGFDPTRTPEQELRDRVIDAVLNGSPKEQRKAKSWHDPEAKPGNRKYKTEQADDTRSRIKNQAVNTQKKVTEINDEAYKLSRTIARKNEKKKKLLEAKKAKNQELIEQLEIEIAELEKKIAKQKMLLSDLRRQRRNLRARLKRSEFKLKELETEIEEGDRKIIENRGDKIIAIKKAMQNAGVDMEALLSEDNAFYEDRVKVAEVVRMAQAKNASGGDVVYEVWIHSLLSAVTTQVINTLSSGFNAAYDQVLVRPLQALINSGYDAVTNSVSPKDAPTFQAYLEYQTYAASNIISASWAAAKLAFKTEAPVLEEEIQYRAKEGQGYRSELPSVAIADEWGGRYVRLPGRGLMFVDEFGKNVITKTTATLVAIDYANAKGLEGTQREQFIRAMLDNPKSAVYKKAYEAALASFFQEESGTAKLASLAKKLPYIGKWVLPFARTPANVWQQGLRKSPLGILNMVFRTGGQLIKMAPGDAEGITYTRAQWSHDLAEQILGWSLTLAAAGAFGGEDDEGMPYITGTSVPGIPENQERTRFASPPTLSFRFPGTQTWISYGRMDPFAVPLGVTVDAINAWKTEGTAQAIEIAFGTVTEMVKERSFMQGLADLVAVYNDPQNKGRSVTTRFAASFMPNLIRSPLKASDDVIREWHTRDGSTHSNWGQEFASRMGFKMTQAKVDPWGRDITKFQFGEADTHTHYSDFLYRALSPIWLQNADRMTKADRYLFHFNQAYPSDNWYPGRPRPEISYGNGERRIMSNDEFYEYQKRVGQLTMDKLAPLFDSGFLDPANPTEEGLDEIRNAVTTSRREIKRDMFGAEIDQVKQDRLQRGGAAAGSGATVVY